MVINKNERDIRVGIDDVAYSAVTLTHVGNEGTGKGEAPEKDDAIDNIIQLNDENGNPVSFEFLDLIEYNSEEYVVLLPAEDDGTGEVVILKIEDGEGDEESYVSVDDEETLGAVYEIFKEKFKDLFNFEG